MATVVQASANGGFSFPTTWANGIVPSTNSYIADAYKYKVNIDTSNINPSLLTLTSSGGFVLSASGTTSINANISAFNQPYPVLLIQGSSTVASITGTIYGGVSSNAIGFTLSSSASAFVYGNVYGGPGVLSGSSTSALGVSSTGFLWVSGNCNSLSATAVNASAGTFTLYGNVSALSATGTTLTGSVNSVVYGNVVGSSVTTATTNYGINHSSTGYLSINGNINAYRSAGVNSTGTGTVSAIGNATGGTVAGVSVARGISKTTGSIFLSGNAYGGSGDVNCVGIYTNANTPYTVTVYGNVSANSGYGVQTAGTASVFVSGSTINGGSLLNAYGLNTGGAAASVTIYNSISGGTATTTYGVYNTTTGTVNIYSNYIAGRTGAGVVNNGVSSTMNIPNASLITAISASGVANTNTGTINITANAVVGASSPAYGIYNSSTGTINLSGNVTAGLANTSYGANNSSTGTVNVTGNVISGPSSSTAHGINNSGGGTVRVTGNVTGGNGVGNYGINNTNGTVTITGILSTGDYTGAYGLYNTSTSTIYNDVSANTNKTSLIYSNGSSTINGSVYTGVNNTSAYAIVLGADNNLYINGNLTGVSNFGNNAGIKCAINSTGSITITGNLYTGIGGIGTNPYIYNMPLIISVNGSIINSTNSNANLIDNINVFGTPILSCNGNIYSGNSKIVNRPNGTVNLYCNQLYGYKNNISFNVGTLNAQVNKIQMGELGAAPFSNLTVTSPSSSFIFTAYTGSFPNYSLQGSATNTLSTLPTIQSITGASNTLKTITFNSAHNITSTAGILSSTGFSDSTWNGIYGIVSIPSTTQVSVTGNFATTPLSYGTSVLIYQTGYYGNSALVITNNAHQLNTKDTVYSYNFYDSTLSWNGTFNTVNLSPSAAYMIGPSSVPVQYGIVAATKYFTALQTPQYAAQTASITPPSPNDVRSGITYYGSNQGNIVIPPLSSVANNTLADNGSGVNVYGTMKIVPTSSVKLNTVYGYLTGTMAVPNPAFVQYNVPVDQTVGNALLYPSDLWSFPVSSVNINSVGSMVKSIMSKPDLTSLI
jgi:hypothetical protein